MKPRKYRALGLPATPGTALLAIVFVLSVSPRLVGATSPASDQSVDPALDTGSVTGQVPMRTLAVNPGSKTPVNVVLLVPYRDTFKWSYPKIMPAVEIALQKIDADENLLADHYLRLRYFDSNCDDANPLNYAVNAYIDKLADVFFGPCCDYSLAPVGRQAMFWKIPLVTVGAEAPDFLTEKLTKYGTLTRAGPKNLLDVSDFLINRIQSFHWKKINILYADDELFVAKSLKGACIKTKLECEPAHLRDHKDKGLMLKKLLGLYNSEYMKQPPTPN
ncbi:hypothetical protein RRG08_047551 [Elysia crispata]|uniref:Receptor ligand binding region domain-containing protein n=1 Tax=Elysia crispata TaxID=231223 RepID=A0AAE1D1V7_9GAST|nr:hypothetical protein RRG08_047551 [Elysia crispata]